MSDLISRQAATSIPIIPKEHRKIFKSIDDAFETGWNEALSCVNMLPSAQPEPHWIPCGERLPEEKQSVLVTDGSVIWVCDIISTDEGYKWEDSHGYWLDLDEWTAWMPLPKPYRGGDE